MAGFKGFQKKLLSQSSSTAPTSQFAGRGFCKPQSTLPVQTKLTVGAPGDQYEQEAERIAGKVTNTPEGEVQMKAIAPSITPLVEREEMPDDEEVQMKADLQRSSDGSVEAGELIESQVNSSRSGGSPLPEDVRSFMESRFAADFSQVRVHTNSEANQMNRALNAQAFTHKQNIYFDQGKNPENDMLTAHELTHVMQQTALQKKSDRYASLSTESEEIQRETKIAPGSPVVGVETQGNKTKVEAIGEWPISSTKTKYATIDGNIVFGGNVEVETIGGEQSEVAKERKPQAKEVAIKYGKKVWDAEKDNIFQLETVSFEFEGGSKRGTDFKDGGKGDEFLGSVTMKMKFAKDLEITGKLTLLKLALAKANNNTLLPFDLECGTFEGQGKKEIPAFEGVAFENYKISGKGVFGLKMLAMPNKSEIAIELMKQYAPQILQRLGMTSLQALRNIMASGPAMVGLFAAYVVVKTTLASLEEAAEEKEVAREARSACNGFTSGFMSALGVKVSGGSQKWYEHGKSQGSAAISAQVKAIQTSPMFAQFNFTSEELLDTMKEQITANPDPFLHMLESEAIPRIKSLYIQQWHQRLTLPQRIFTNTDSAERRIRLRLGLNIDGPLPDPMSIPSSN